MTEFALEKMVDLALQLRRHCWQDLVFDIELPEARQDYIAANSGVMLPITHKGDPIRHADLCEQLSRGKQPWFISAYALANLMFNEADEYTLDDVNFDTLDQTQAAMFEVRRATKSALQSAPTTLERGIALLENAAGNKARKVIRKAAKRPAPRAKRVVKKATRKR